MSKSLFPPSMILYLKYIGGLVFLIFSPLQYFLPLKFFKRKNIYLFFKKKASGGWLARAAGLTDDKDSGIQDTRKCGRLLRYPQSPPADAFTRDDNEVISSLCLVCLPSLFASDRYRQRANYKRCLKKTTTTNQKWRERESPSSFTRKFEARL